MVWRSHCMACCYSWESNTKKIVEPLRAKRRNMRTLFKKQEHSTSPSCSCDLKLTEVIHIQSWFGSGNCWEGSCGFILICHNHCLSSLSKRMLRQTSLYCKNSSSSFVWFGPQNVYLSRFKTNILANLLHKHDQWPILYFQRILKMLTEQWSKFGVWSLNNCSLACALQMQSALDWYSN